MFISQLCNFFLLFFELSLQFVFMELHFSNVAVQQLNLFIQDGQFLIFLNELCSQYVTLIHNHIVVFLLSNLLPLGFLYDLLKVGNVTLLVSYNFLSRVGFCLSPFLVCLYLRILCLDLPELFIVF